jgi:hypothetical protein
MSDLQINGRIDNLNGKPNGYMTVTNPLSNGLTPSATINVNHGKFGGGMDI